MAADRIHIADPNPTHCSSCFGQKVDQIHVDFDAAYDGPVVPAQTNVAGMVGQPIDDLILCADCIRAAAKLIGLENHDELRTELSDVARARDELLGRLEKALEHVARLESAGQSRHELEQTGAIKPAKRKPAAAKP